MWRCMRFIRIPRPNRPFFDAVELKGGGDATSAARAVLQTGEFDFAWNMQVEHQVLSGLERGGKGKVLVTPGAAIEHIQVNFTDPWTEVESERSSLKKPHPFQTDPLIRQAYALAVDRRTIAEQLYGTGGQPRAISWLLHHALSRPIPPGSSTRRKRRHCWTRRGGNAVAMGYGSKMISA